MISRTTAIVLLLAVAAGVGLASVLLPPIPQPLSYHHFADQRPWLDIPNFGDVASNLPFAVIGVWGLVFLWRLSPEEQGRCFADARERWPYVLVFAGLLLTAFGSTYYHLAPDNARLVWDRLPIILVFMSLLAAVIAERISVRAGLRLLPVLLLIGAGSVLLWYAGELRRHGDLRLYAAVQVYSAMVLLLALLFPAKYTRGSSFAVVVGLYALAKILEMTDHQIFALGRIVSGHTLKHLAAAMAGYWILRMLRHRQIVP